MINQTNLIPGLFGVLGGKNPGNSRDAVKSMVQRMSYGGRDIAGSYENEMLGVHLGWVCPAQFQGINLPIWNPGKTVGLLLFGETYEDKEEAARGPAASEQWKDLMGAYEKEGISCFEKLNGWFGGVLMDLEKRCTIIFNDRYGLYRIHYSQTADAFYFASEAKAILSAVPETRQLNMKSLAEFMSCGCTLQDRSMFSGIALLPGAAAWTFEPGRRASRECYFDKEKWEKQEPLEFHPWYERLKQTWIRILPRYFEGEKIGLSLTGGVDSRMVLAWAPAKAAGALTCYTFAGKYRDSMDISVSREVARVCGRPHETIYVDSGFLSSFPDLAADCVLLSDGTMDVTGSVDLYVQTMARQIAPVRVTGTNGGEIMRSLVAFKPGGVSAEPFSPDFANMLPAAAVTYSKEMCGNRLSFTAFKQVPWYMNTKFSVERSQILLRMPYFDNDLVSLVYRAPANLPPDNEVALKLIADGNAALGQIGTDRGLAFGSGSWLRQARHLYHQFTFKLEYAYDYGMPHWLARLDHMFSPLQMEKYILGRHKFHHFRVWYRDELSGYLKEILLDSRTVKRPYLQGSAIERMVRDHLAGTRNYTREFHKIIAAELIERLLIEQRQ